MKNETFEVVLLFIFGIVIEDGIRDDSPQGIKNLISELCDIATVCIFGVSNLRFIYELSSPYVDFIGE